MATAFVRGAQTLNSMFVKPIMRKGYHKKSSSHNTTRETMELEAKEERNMSHMGLGEGGGEASNFWGPEHRTGIYCPKGQEKVLENVYSNAGKDFDVHWFYGESK